MGGSEGAHLDVVAHQHERHPTAAGEAKLLAQGLGRLAWIRQMPGALRNRTAMGGVLAGIQLKEASRY
jgi:hypothetical protein